VSRKFDLVVDVRSKLEFLFGHLPDAVCIPVTRIPDDLQKRADVKTDSRILVYCASGARSAMAANELRAAGFRNVVDGGGMTAARAYLDP
jgi:rhodanese-related sulfurtransferase